MKRLIQFRTEDRTITGTVMEYGMVSPSHRERFLSGAILHPDPLWLDWEHDLEKVIVHEGSGLELDHTDEAFKVRAVLPPIPIADLALEAIDKGVKNGLSVEFYDIESTMNNGIKDISKAYVKGIGLVGSPSYSTSVINRRSKRNIIWAF